MTAVAGTNSKDFRERGGRQTVVELRIANTIYSTPAPKPSMSEVAQRTRADKNAIEHLLDDKEEKLGCVLCFDFSQVVREHHVITCGDHFSRGFLDSNVPKVIEAWEGIKFNILSYEEIARRLTIRICLPIPTPSKF